MDEAKGCTRISAFACRVVFFCLFVFVFYHQDEERYWGKGREMLNLPQDTKII